MIENTLMIQTLTNVGWHDYCEVGIETDIIDIDGNILKTGDTIEIINANYYNKGIDNPEVGLSMILFDQYANFISSSKFYADGWSNMDWSESDNYIIRKTNKNYFHPHTRIVEKTND